MLSMEDFRDLFGRKVVGRDGGSLGKVDQLYADREDGEPIFLTVHTGLFGLHTHFVPTKDARLDGDTVAVPYDSDKVKAAPSIPADGELSPEEEERLYRHYGITSAAAAGAIAEGPGDAQLGHPTGMAGAENPPIATEHTKGMSGQEGGPSWPAAHEPGMAGQADEMPHPTHHPSGMAGQVTLTQYRLRRWTPRRSTVRLPDTPAATDQRLTKS
jgi:sporulation protein YlmC with PRC-barrel domain